VIINSNNIIEFGMEEYISNTDWLSCDKNHVYQCYVPETAGNVSGAVAEDIVHRFCVACCDNAVQTYRREISL
jgi:hypothetical protein